MQPGRGQLLRSSWKPVLHTEVPQSSAHVLLVGAKVGGEGRGTKPPEIRLRACF